MKIGRFYITPTGEPFYNMALDEWLFEDIQKESSTSPVVLRLYSWKSEAITIGYNQKASKTIDRLLLDTDIPIIRRITGGRAIYHDLSEITFSFAVCLDMLPKNLRSLSETNRLISQTLIEILKEIGIKAFWGKKTLERNPNVRSDNRRTMSCFNSVSRYELVSDQSKVVAGAQRRKGCFMIHQGSIKINGIIACPAIGQRENFCMSAKYKNSGIHYSIDDFFGVFERIFGAHFGFDFKTSRFSSSKQEEFERFFRNFIKIYSTKRGIN
jgi:lipoate-protein ligase A